DDILRAQMDGTFRRIDASEGSLWLRDVEEKHLVTVYNTGPNADRIVLEHLQPLDRGIVSMVYGTGRTFADVDVHRSREQDKTLDTRLGVLTCSMIAVPFRFAGQTRGVINAVKLKPAASTDPDPPPFAEDATQQMQLLGATLERLVDLKLVQVCLGIARG
ncbi:MAG: GAF domain-containing protein, partial [Planctomycetota bacterium]